MGHSRDRPRYSLGDVVRLTGLTKPLLHAWERRYGVVRPARTRSGRRAYSEDEVLHLQLLRQCVDAGHRIGFLASLEVSALKRLARQQEGQGAPVGLDDLLRDVDGLDVLALEHRLSVQFAALGPLSFARDVVAPLMTEVGHRCERQEISVAGEHLISATLRTLLGQALHLTRRASAGPAVIFTTPEGELHELGLLVAALCAQSAGLRVIYLGPQLPAREVALASRRWGAEVVNLSVSSLGREQLSVRVAEVLAVLPEGVQLWLGGASVAVLDGETIEGATTFRDIADFDLALRSLRLRGDGR